MGLPLRKMSLDDFLAWENDQVERHEFYQGEVIAMVGARRVHECTVSNLVVELGSALRGSPCRVYASNMKLLVADDTVLYPDIQVSCDRADRTAETALRSPTLVVEVLSPSTQAYDRSQKFALYRRLASLQEYLLIDPESRRVEAFRRNADDQWVFHDMSQDELLAVPCLTVTVPMAQVFDGVDPPPQ